MATINKNYDKLEGGYLFSEIARRVQAFSEKNPNVSILRLGIGTTTQPLPPTTVKGLHLGVEKLANAKTYTGYGDEQGDLRLRQALVDWYSKRGIKFSVKEIFISDGAKSDSANIQSIFGEDNTIAVSDPVYPVYVDSNVIAGKTDRYENGRYKGITYLPCRKENGFIPHPPKKKVDLIYLCSPNNPTGAVATKKQLKEFVDYARNHKSVIIFDAAYAEFIQNKSLPKSIYEIPGAKTCAIEINSFSKFAGFTGVRLGWTVVPLDLVTEDAKIGKVNALWSRRQTTMFNGASNIAQEGGISALSKKGQQECRKVVAYYMENAKLIKQGLQTAGFEAFGGENAPYIWVKTPVNMNSWEFFDMLLDQAHVVCTPGVGFGREGEGYVRFSAFGYRDTIKKAVESIQNLNKRK